MSAAESLAGAILELHVDAVAAGGACVARHAGRVVFIRHALPGEQVKALVTEDRGSFCRADAIEVLSPSPDRVEPPCPYARPGRCGGCDWQHASADAQRRLKAEVIRDQFARLAGIELPPLDVEELPGGLLGWRTRVDYAVQRNGRTGLRRHRSHEIEPVDRCLLGAPGIGDAEVLSRRWPGLIGIEPARGDAGDIALIAHRSGGPTRTRGRRPPDRVAVIQGPARLGHEVLGRSFEAAAEGFWQVHPAAARTFAQALLDELQPGPGERVLDLYAGAGALTAALAQAVGETGQVVAVESARSAVEDARRNLADLPWVRVEQGRVDADRLTELDLRPDLVVLDPPRAGAGAAVMRALIALGPRAIGYVSCDPATLARDVAAAQEEGWRLARLRAFDAFPMTHHVECVATLRPDIDRSAP